MPLCLEDIKSSLDKSDIKVKYLPQSHPDLSKINNIEHMKRTQYDTD